MSKVAQPQISGIDASKLTQAKTATGQLKQNTMPWGARRKEDQSRTHYISIEVADHIIERVTALETADLRRFLLIVTKNMQCIPIVIVMQKYNWYLLSMLEQLHASRTSLG